MDAIWRVELFGGLRASRGEYEITRFRSQRTAGLLAYLAFHLGEWQPREVLMDLLWRDFEPEAARTGLRVALSSLRHQLEPPGVVAGSVLTADPQRVRLSADSVETDLAEFEAAVSASHRCTDRDERIRFLARAVSVYQGDLLSGLYQDWIPNQVLQLREVYLDSVLSLVALLESASRHAAAMEYALSASSLDPTDEAVCQVVMRLMVALGQPAAALRQYNALRAALRDELGTEPSAELVRIAQQLQEAHSATMEQMPERPKAAAPRPAPVAFVSGIATILCVRRTQGPNGDYGRLMATARRHQGDPIPTGSSVVCAGFAHPLDALECAVEIGRDQGARLAIALHSGDIGSGGSGIVVEAGRAAAIAASGHPGQILCAEATASLLRPDLLNGIHLHLLGTYRSGDAAAFERVFEIRGLNPTVSDHPPLNAQAEHATRVPMCPNRFFGREAEIARIADLLQDPATRLISLTGPPGCGKTRLAIEVARCLTPRFGGRVWFVPLRALADARLIADSIVRVMEIRVPTGRSALQVLCDSVSDTSGLLVLDNLEHLAEEGTDTVDAILSSSSQLKCMITSRRRLVVPGERVFPVHPLPLPSDAESATPLELLRCPSAAMFVDRAQASRPDFQVTAANVRAIAELCRRLEGIPLALELAAARAATMPLSTLMDRWQQLRSARRRPSAPGLWASMDAAIEWSIGLLEPELRQFLAQLSVFRGGWTVEAAQAVCDTPDVADSLSALADCSLVRAEWSGDEVRYGMLQFLREHAAASLSEAETADVRRRHAEYYLTPARLVMQAWRKGEFGRDAVDAAERDLNNYRTAIEYWLAARNDACSALEMATYLDGLWAERGSINEYREWVEAALALDPNLEFCRPVSIAIASGLFARVCDRARHIALAEWCARSDDQAVSLAGLGHLASAALAGGDAERAVNLFRQVVEAMRAWRVPWRIALALGNLASAMTCGGLYARARDAIEEGISLVPEDSAPQANLLDHLGSLECLLGKVSATNEAVNRAVRLYTETGQTSAADRVLGLLGRMRIREGRTDEAVPLVEKSLVAAKQADAPVIQAGALASLALAAYTEGRLAEGIRLLEEALPMLGPDPSVFDKAPILISLGWTWADAGHPDTAEGPAREALELAYRTKAPHLVADALYASAFVARARGNHLRAVRLAGAADAIRSRAGIRALHFERQQATRIWDTAAPSVGEAAAQRAYDAGQELTMDAAVEEALAPQ